ncbi:MAG: DinB family protein [Candidatus Eiseniibacteriota bacterium]
MEERMSATGGSSETVEEYKARIFSYVAGADPLVLQARAPDVLAALLKGLSTDDLGQRPAPGKWCIREIVAHLADDELVGAYRIRLILSAPGTAIQAFDQDVWASTGRYRTSDVMDALALYRALRFANLKLLQSLSTQEWDMFGVHAERGRESLRDVAMYFAGHDINHFRQIESIRRLLGMATPESGAADVHVVAGASCGPRRAATT